MLLQVARPTSRCAGPASRDQQHLSAPSLAHLFDMKRSYLPAALLVGFLAWSFGFTAAQDQAPDTAIFMPVQEVGNTVRKPKA